MIILSFILIAVLAAVDQLLKSIVVADLKPITSISLIPNFLELHYIENSGAAFGIFQNGTIFFAIITAILSAVIIVMLFKYKKHDFWTYAAAIMVVAGGIGNLIDRLVYGYVVDYIHVMFFDYIFNFADCLVVVGVIFFLIHILFFMDKNKGEHAKRG